MKIVGHWSIISLSYKNYKKEDVLYKNIGVEEAKILIGNGGITVLDVRLKEDYEKKSFQEQ